MLSNTTIQCDQRLKQKATRHWCTRSGIRKTREFLHDVFQL